MNQVKNSDLPHMNHRVYDKTAEPYAVISSGETVSLDTNDAWSGVFTKNGVAEPALVELSEKLAAPATGPIVVKDSEPGDWLKIKINKLQPANVGVAAIGDPVFLLNDRFGPPVQPFKARLADVEDGCIILNERVKIPVRPMIGTIGTTLADEVQKIRYEGIWGGNLDAPTIGQGCELWLPVFTEGAYLYMGDCHARQGDGEILSPFEVSAHIELTVELVKAAEKSSVGRWPRIITDDAIETVGVSNTFEKATEIALGEMIDWLVAEYGFDQEDAAFFCGSVVDARPAAIVNHMTSARCVIAKEFLPKD